MSFTCEKEIWYVKYDLSNCALKKLNHFVLLIAKIVVLFQPTVVIDFCKWQEAFSALFLPGLL